MAVLPLSQASDRTRRRLAWGVPVLVAGAVAVGVTVAATSSDATPKLPTRTAKQLLVAVQQTKVTAFSGRITETTDLGLPSLPGSGSSRASLSWSSFLTGSHSFRVWADGRDKQRLALIGELSEAEIVHNGKDVWTYTSDTNSVSHHVLGAATGRHQADRAPARTGTPADLTPSALADRALAAITPSTKVSVDTAQTVAGRAAYTLDLAPRAADSTVSRIAIAIDAKKYVPLQVQVFGTSSSPAISVGFTDISFSTPPASTFVFHRPAGATTESNPLTARRGDRHGDRGPAPMPVRPGPATHASPKVLGSGWTSVLELPDAATSGLGGGLLRDATSPVGSSGERLLHTTLVNALLLPDGRVFVGAVTPSALEHLAATTPR